MPGPLAPLVQTGVINFKAFRGMHLGKLGLANRIFAFLRSMIEVYLVMDNFGTFAYLPTVQEFPLQYRDFNHFRCSVQAYRAKFHLYSDF